MGNEQVASGAGGAAAAGSGSAGGTAIPQAKLPPTIPQIEAMLEEVRQGNERTAAELKELAKEFPGLKAKLEELTAAPKPAPTAAPPKKPWKLLPWLED